MLARTLTALVVALVLAAAGTGATLGADEPTLGVTLAPTPLIAAETDTLIIVNRSTIDATFDLTIEGNTGWQVEPTHFTLAPDAVQEVKVREVGTGQSTLVTRFYATVAEPGMEAGVGEISGSLLLEAPTDYTLLIAAGLLAGLLGVALLAAFAITHVRRRRRIA